MKFIMAGLFIIIYLTFCSSIGEGGGRGPTVTNMTFSSMTSCVSFMRSRSGGDLRIIRDTPNIVTGKFSSGQSFACERNETGSRGVTINGWFTN